MKLELTPSYEIGQKIETIRESQKLSLDNMAASLGMSREGYRKIEKGETDISLGRLAQIGEALKVDWRRLIVDDVKVTFVHSVHQNETVNIQQSMNGADLNKRLEKLEKESAEKSEIIETLRLALNKSLKD